MARANTVDPLVPVDPDFMNAYNGDGNKIPDFVDLSDWNTGSSRAADPMATIREAHRLVRTASNGPATKNALLRTELFVEDYLK